jgi:hypothetical protein
MFVLILVCVTFDLELVPHEIVLDTSIRNTKQKTSIEKYEPPTEELGVETIRTSVLRRNLHKWPNIFSVCHSEALECFLVLVGFVLCMLSTYMTSLVIISAKISA